MVHDQAISKYMEHGDCLLWEPGLVWLHVISVHIPEQIDHRFRSKLTTHSVPN
jgi:hypothetical protein